MNNNVYDSIVIGAGLAGLMTARELMLSGQKVALYEAGSVGGECSWAGGGILSPLYPWRELAILSELTVVSQRLYPEISHELFEKTGIDPEWQQCGMLLLNVDDSDDVQSWVLKNQYPIELLNEDQLHRNFNVRVRNSGTALWLPKVAQVRNPRLIRALKSYLLQAGVDIFEKTRVNRLRTRGGKLQEIETARGNVSVPVVVLSAGAWSCDLLPAINIRPVRGQMLCYQAPRDYLTHILLKDNIYAIPRRDGHILVGSTVEEVGYDKTITTEARMFLAEAAEKLLPEINQFPLVTQWSGLRPATTSGIPYISAHPEIEGLYLNTGHFRNGILFASGAARLLADIILDRNPVVERNIFQFEAA